MRKLMFNQQDDPLKKFRQMEDEKERSHFEDIPKQKQCLDPSHNPPSHLHIPFGKRYVHVCPSCGFKITLTPPQITW